MGSGAEIHKRLDDFVREQEEVGKQSLRGGSHFGLSREGSYVNSWQMNFERIGYIAGRYIVDDFGSNSIIQIMVPPTETGMVPSMNEQQPFGWTGNINEYSAELAVWWAFELLSDGEALQFMKEHRPSVVFRYFDDNGFRELEARFNGKIWMAERIT